MAKVTNVMKVVVGEGEVRCVRSCKWYMFVFLIKLYVLHALLPCLSCDGKKFQLVFINTLKYVPDRIWIEERIVTPPPFQHSITLFMLPLVVTENIILMRKNYKFGLHIGYSLGTHCWWYIYEYFIIWGWGYNFQLWF